MSTPLFGATGDSAADVQFFAAEAAMNSLLLTARRRLGMDLVVLVSDEGDASALTRVFPAFWLRGSEPLADRSDDVADRFEEYFLDLHLGPSLSSPSVTRSEEAAQVAEYVRVPLTATSGAVFGLLCAFPRRNEAVDEGAVRTLNRLGETLSEFVAAGEDDWTRPVAARKVLRRLRNAGGPAIVFQPIVDLQSGERLGYEALARFPVDAPPPEAWFQMAEQLEEGVALEIAALTHAFEHVGHLEGRMAVNLSEAALASPVVHELLSQAPVERLTIEVTERRAVRDYSAVAEFVRPFRERGMHLAIDDVGAGYSSLRHVLSLQPEMVKLDITLVRGIDTDPQKRALAESMVGFTAKTGARLVAEGVETAAEVDSLRELGVRYGQGFHLGNPAPCPQHPAAEFRLPRMEYDA